MAHAFCPTPPALNSDGEPDSTRNALHLDNDAEVLRQELWKLRLDQRLGGFRFFRPGREPVDHMETDALMRAACWEILRDARAAGQRVHYVKEEGGGMVRVFLGD